MSVLIDEHKNYPIAGNPCCGVLYNAIFVFYCFGVFFVGFFVVVLFCFSLFSTFF
jgi:hypothetical protein